MSNRTEDFQPISEQVNSSLGVLRNAGFRHLAHLSSAAIIAEEVVAVAANCPVVFLKDEASGRFELTALLGLTAGENLFVDSEGAWLGTLMLAGLSVLPFGMDSGCENEAERMLIDMNSPLVSEGRGQRLYENGEETSFLQEQRELLELNVDGFLQSQRLVEELVNRNLITEFMLQVEETDASPRVIRDLYTINVDEFPYMSDKDVVAFHRQHYWGVIFAIQQSLAQFRRLVQWRNRAAPEHKVKVTVHLKREDAD